MAGQVVLLSGGVDSCVAATLSLCDGHDVYGLAVAYGQRHSCELDAAERVASSLGIRLHLVRADLSSVAGASALLGGSSPLKRRDIDAIVSDRAPTTFVPARNAIFLAVAAAFARSIGVGTVVIGSNADDSNGYPDCRREFFDAFEKTSMLGGFGVDVSSPLVTMTKREVVELGRCIGAPLDLTWSCYSPVGEDGAEAPCGECDACVLRGRAML